ncbi:hypothetical protein SAE01_10070 [Segetibacter aerophilus]|uniref:Uncharacterized protein n=1 Tax=Segetibacter aerophilus TaxID=670293 RepID=A0A512B972_9BACT|nr:hypothetical protein SAE01_10070 [Segetibacter aerophilus]
MVTHPAQVNPTTKGFIHPTCLILVSLKAFGVNVYHAAAMGKAEINKNWLGDNESSL